MQEVTFTEAVNLDVSEFAVIQKNSEAGNIAFSSSKSGYIVEGDSMI